MKLWILVEAKDGTVDEEGVHLFTSYDKAREKEREIALEEGFELETDEEPDWSESEDVCVVIAEREV